MKQINTHLNMKRIWCYCLIAALGGFLFGYDWVVIGGAKPFYEAYFNITSPFVSGWAMSASLIGCIIGALIVGSLSNRLGRKIPLYITAILFIISSIGTAVVTQFDVFIFWRIIGGLGVGMASALSPMYIAEISPAKQRGKFVAINQLTIVVGMLIAQLVNLCIAKPVADGASLHDIAISWNGLIGWRYMFGVCAVPALFLLVLAFIIPESPRWLVKVGQAKKAGQLLLLLGNTEYASSTLNEIQKNIDANQGRFSFKMLGQANIRPILLIGVVLAVFQQWCGLNVVFNYAQEIFSSAGFNINGTLESIVATGLINLIFTIIALPLVDKIGRRKLMWIGSIGLTIIYILIASAYAMHILGLPVLVLVLIAIAIYALTLAPVTWVLLSEIFPNQVRESAISIATFALWVGCFALTYTFPIFNAKLGAAGSFSVYAVICLVGFVFILCKVPETKDKSLEELEKMLAKQK